MESSAQNASTDGDTWPSMGAFFLFLKGLSIVLFARVISTPNFDQTRHEKPDLGSKLS
jgi:hypothetical protein